VNATESTKEKPAFLAEVERLMEEKGIEDLEELHRRFALTEHAYIPVPGLHRGKAVSFEEFKRHMNCERGGLYGPVIKGLTEVFGMERPKDDKEIAELTLAYIKCEPPFRFRA
jgi:hypothetical protein